jgi:hypothetical protein
MRNTVQSILLLFCLVLLGNSVSFAQSTPKAEKSVSVKKGIGLGRFPDWLGARELKELNVAWFYNWQATNSKFNTQVEFIPMLRAGKVGPGLTRGDFILGYNEPDHPKQDNISVKEGLANWSRVTAKGKFVVSPAMCKDPINNEWLPDFMKAKPKVDAIAVHWYKGPNSKKFIDDMETIYRAYDLPLWITEFACQTSESSKTDPKKFSQQEVNQFISEVTRWMERTPWVQRYAWHSSGEGTSCLYDDSGKSLSATGKAYAKAPK